MSEVEIPSGAIREAPMPKCPYCGSATRIDTYRRRIGKATPSVFETAQVKCKRQSCGMAGPLFKGPDSRERARKHWVQFWADSDAAELARQREVIAGLRASLAETAAVLQAIGGEGVWRVSGERVTVDEVLDRADAALGAALSRTQAGDGEKGQTDE